MAEQGTVVLYHGTDLESALDILNNGLNSDHLQALQTSRKTQLGSGWYVTDNLAAAWYFASIAPGNRGRGSTVIEIELFIEHFEILLEQQFVAKSKIVNVRFEADQYKFDLQTFDFLNQHAVFRPYRPQEK